MAPPASAMAVAPPAVAATAAKPAAARGAWRRRAVSVPAHARRGASGRIAAATSNNTKPNQPTNARRSLVARVSSPSRDAESTDAVTPQAAPWDACRAALIAARPGDVVQLYRTPALGAAQADALLAKANAAHAPLAPYASVQTEACFNLEIAAPLDPSDADTLLWLLAETYEADQLTSESAFSLSHEGEGVKGEDSFVVEVGPRMSFSTAWSSNAVSVFEACGLAQGKVPRCERSLRFRVRTHAATNSGAGGAADAIGLPHLEASFAAGVHDRMTEQVYRAPLRSFAPSSPSSEEGGGEGPPPTQLVPVMAEGAAALEAVNASMGLAFDDQDLAYYLRLFRDELKVRPHAHTRTRTRTCPRALLLTPTRMRNPFLPFIPSLPLPLSLLFLSFSLSSLSLSLFLSLFFSLFLSLFCLEGPHER